MKLDKSLHQEFQDGDYYKFEDDRAEERIKKDQVCLFSSSCKTVVPVVQLQCQVGTCISF